MGKLSTHVLDVTRGCPGNEIDIQLFSCSNEERISLGTAKTNADGRTDKPMLEGEALKTGTYELVFDVSSYYTKTIYDKIAIRFKVAEGQSYHIPLLLSPYSYSTYRGS